MVVDAGGRFRLVYKLSEADRRERRVFGELRDRRAPGGESGRNLDHELVHRPVPGGDKRADPNRLLGNESVSADVLKLGVLESRDRGLEMRPGQPRLARASRPSAEFRDGVAQWK